MRVEEDRDVEMVIAWLAVGVILVAVELTHLAFFALFAAMGAFAAALVALVLPSAVPLQVIVAVLVALVGIVAVRPVMSRAMHRKGDGHPARGVHGTFVGEEVLTLDVVGDGAHPGHVRLAGERWLAESGPGVPIPEGSKVLVTGLRGTTLIVWPVGGQVPKLAEPPPSRSEGDQP